jgi:ferrous iron transport protein A
MVCGVEHCGATGQRLLAMGLMPGCELKFVRNAPLGDPMMVETSTGVICLRRREAAMVQVERTK